MFKVGEYLVFKKDVCKVSKIKEKVYNDLDYYVLEPISDSSLTLQIPTSSDQIRKLLTKKQVEDLINKIPEIKIIDTENDKMLENIYKEYLNTNQHENFISIIKTTFMRNKERVDNNKKPGDKDNNYFETAEKFLYNEFAVVLGMNFQEVKLYVEQRVAALKN